MIDIEQAISAYNDQREILAAARSKANRKHLYIFIALAIALAAAALWIYLSSSDVALYLVPIAGTFGLVFAVEMSGRAADKPGKILQKTLRADIYPTLFHPVQDLRFQTATNGFFDEIPHDIKPDAIRYEWGDLIEGTYQEQPIAINEVTGFNTRGLANDRKVVEIFKGFALRIGLDHSVPNLSVHSGPDVFEQLLMEQYRAGGVEAQRPFEDKHFERIFDIHCENEGFANSIFSETGRSTFMSLQGIVSKSPTQLAARGSTAYVLVSKRDEIFGLPSIDAPFDQETDGRQLQEEMQRILDLCDGIRELLKTAPPL